MFAMHPVTGLGSTGLQFRETELVFSLPVRALGIIAAGDRAFNLC